ncbi:peptide deformylase [Anthocerotibacter panamensis]|uniref:peptide deformylase n=1 Tax=Anthocerotibacter panamensis TaxID=2857077 RepID=UPI001C403FE9|nr:peptide deformylase [Anthocerotibacter panamensis]
MSSQPMVSKEKSTSPPLKVHTMGDRVLRAPSKNVAAINNEVRILARQMFETMYSSDGIGLAAPQVGVNKRMITIDTDPNEAANPVWVMINPVIKKVVPELVVDQEGCLSVPGVFADVVRPTAIVVSYRDLTGKPQAIEARGLLARVIQHEIDHLEGVLFVDRVENQLALAQDLLKRGFAMRDVQYVGR